MKILVLLHTVSIYSLFLAQISCLDDVILLSIRMNISVFRLSQNTKTGTENDFLMIFFKSAQKYPKRFYDPTDLWIFRLHCCIFLPVKTCLSHMPQYHGQLLTTMAVVMVTYKCHNQLLTGSRFQSAQQHFTNHLLWSVTPKRWSSLPGWTLLFSPLLNSEPQL